MTASLQAELVTTRAAFDALEAEWDALVAAHHRPQVFYSHAWHAAVDAAYGATRTFCTVVVRDPERRVVGIAPLVRDERGSISFAGLPHADYCDLLVADGVHPAAVWNCVVPALDAAGVGRGLLRHVQEGGHLRRALDPSESDHCAPAVAARCAVRQGDPCPTLLVPAEDRDEIIQPILKKKSLKRHEKALARGGELRFERVTDRAAVRAHLDEFFVQHAARRAMAGDQSLFARDETRQFYEELVTRLDPADELHFTVLHCGAGVAAFHLGFERDGCLTWYKPTIDVNLWDHGPGEVLIKRLVEWVRDAELVELDFTRGDEAFKDRFTNHRRHNADVEILPAGGLARARAGLRQRAAAAVRARPRLRKLLASSQTALAECLRVLRKHGPFRVAGKVARKLWRRWVRAQDEVLVFRTTPATAAEGRVARDDLSLTAACLADLAACATEAPEFFTGDRLQTARKRIKAGDQPHVARIDGRLAHVAWVGQRDRIVATEVGTENEIPLEASATVIFDCWTPPSARGQGVYPWVIRELAAAASTSTAWIYCEARNLASRRGIEKAGFVPAGRMWRTVRWGRRLTRGVDLPR